jgi:hypothetical protein
MNKITARKIRVARVNGRVAALSLKATGSQMLREVAEDAGTYSASTDGSVLSDDRKLQTFREALRDSIRQNRSAIEKLSKR